MKVDINQHAGYWLKSISICILLAAEETGFIHYKVIVGWLFPIKFSIKWNISDAFEENIEKQPIIKNVSPF